MLMLLNKVAKTTLTPPASSKKKKKNPTERSLIPYNKLLNNRKHRRLSFWAIIFSGFMNYHLLKALTMFTFCFAIFLPASEIFRVSVNVGVEKYIVCQTSSVLEIKTVLPLRSDFSSLRVNVKSNSKSARWQISCCMETRMKYTIMPVKFIW